MKPYYSPPFKQAGLSKLIADPETLIITDLDGTVLDGFNPVSDRLKRLSRDKNPYELNMKSDIYADNAMNVYFQPGYANIIQQKALNNYVSLTGRSLEQLKEIAAQSNMSTDRLPPAITTHGELLTIGKQSIPVLPFTDAETQFIQKSHQFITTLDKDVRAFLEERNISLPQPSPQLQIEKKAFAAGINARAYFDLPELRNNLELQNQFMMHLKEKFIQFLDNDENPSLPNVTGRKSFVISEEPAGLEIHRGHINKAVGLKRYLEHCKQLGTLPKRVIFFGDSLFKEGKPQGTDYSAMEYVKNKTER